MDAAAASMVLGMSDITSIIVEYAVDTRVIGVLSCCFQGSYGALGILAWQVRGDYESFQGWLGDPPFPYRCWEEVPEEWYINNRDTNRWGAEDSDADSSSSWVSPPWDSVMLEFYDSD